MSDFGDYEVSDDSAGTSTQREANAQGWSGTQTLTAGSGMQAALLAAHFDQARDYTIQFYTSPPQNNGANPGLYRAIAQVSWNVEGNQVIRSFDIGNGTTISGCGQAVSVNILDATVNAPAPGPGVNNSYIVSAAVSQGTRPTTGLPVTLYQQNGTLAPGQYVDISIPAAGVIGLEVDTVDINNSDTIPTFVQVTINYGFSFLVQYSPTIRPGFVPLPPNATTVTVTNNSGTDYIVFSLIWAIDG
jgi:hypothetical protein